MTWAHFLSHHRLGPWLAALCLSCGVAEAHDFWIQPAAFALPPGGSTTLSLQVGHGNIRQKSLMEADRILRFDSVSTAGSIDRRKALILGKADADSALHFTDASIQVLALETNGSYSELPGIRFTDYLKVEGLTPALELRSRMRTSDAPGREIYSRRCKALIQVGSYKKGDDAVVSKAVGLSLEIVPEANPYAPEFSGTLPVKVLYNGAPLPGALVKLNNLEFDDRPIAAKQTDAQGRAVFSLPRIGSWQLNVIWTRPIQSDPKAEFETTFSSLTFGFPSTRK